MNKLNIKCLLGLIDHLSYDDDIQLKKSLLNKCFIIVDYRAYKTYTIQAKDQEDLLNKMFSMNIPKCLTPSNFIDDDTFINIVINRYIPMVGCIDHCVLCGHFVYLHGCEHITNKIHNLKRSELSMNDYKKIINNMISLRIFQVEEIRFETENLTISKF
jgi:hypothetical protein